MDATSSDRSPVIVAVGEAVDRPVDPADAREPVALMADALRAAEADAGARLLPALDSLELVAQVTWRYRDPVALLAQRLGVAPARTVNASMGGETPIRLTHEAALRIAAGKGEVAAIVGGESAHALSKAIQAGGPPLHWTAQVSREEVAKVAFSGLPLSPSARAAGAVSPVHIYPLYENAWHHARGRTPAQGLAQDAALWARYAAVAAANPSAWIRTAPAAAEIGATAPRNRPVAFPYPKLMTANPLVNQAAAVVVASLGWARRAGVAEDRLVRIWGGGAAQEPGDYLLRDLYDRSSAQAAALDRAVRVAGGDASAFDLAELYSCFPVVPSMALEHVKLRPGVEPTVAGGLTFFGGPLNNYMAHAVAAMVRRLRAGEGRLGLLYGQGGVVSKHHTLVVSRDPPPAPLHGEVSVQADADAARGPVPPLTEDYAGPATVETYTAVYDASGAPAYGVVVARTPDGARLIARTPAADADGVARLTDPHRSAIGLRGRVGATAGGMVWREA